MDMKKFAPWNWFKHEEEGTNSNVPITRVNDRTVSSAPGVLKPMVQLHQEMNRLFESAFRGFDVSPFSSDLSMPLISGQLKPKVDIGANEQEYFINVEVPGVSEKDVKVEIANNTLTIRGEKKQEQEKKEENYYRIERSYGSFQRLLSLPEDANQEDIKATFKNGVLTVKMSRKTSPKANIKQVEIKSSE